MFENLAAQMTLDKEKLAKIETSEMGKPINESRFVIQKSIDIITHYKHNMSEYLQPQLVNSVANKSYITQLPLGPIFNIAPYNFPIWLAFKSIIPKLTVGNTIILKGADCCTESTLAIQEVFKNAGWGDEVQSVIINPEGGEYIISHP